MNNHATLQSRVNKILKARKVQKQAIEREKLAFHMAEEEREKAQAPFMKEIKQLVPAIQQIRPEIPYVPVAQPISDQIQSTPINRRLQLDETIVEDDSFSDALSALPTPRPMRDPIQKSRITSMLFNLHRHTQNASTQFEIDLQGKLGTYGYVNLEKLYNDDVLEVWIDGKESSKTRPPDITYKNPPVGLIALLVLPMKDLAKAPVTINQADIASYNAIMNEVAYKNPSQSNKYKTYIKPYYKSSSPIPSDLHFRFKRGSGLTQHKDCVTTVSDLKHRFLVLSASKDAGNTSQVIDTELRSILGTLLKKGHISYGMHKQYYNKLGLS